MPRTAVALLLVAACCALAAEAHYSGRHRYEKTRFDRSIHSEPERFVNYGDARIHYVNKKPRIYTDLAMNYTVYKDSAQSICYLEKLRSKHLDQMNQWLDVIRGGKQRIYATDRSLTKIEAWRLAGGRIVDFCKGMTIVLLEENKSDLQNSEEPIYNYLIEDENDIIQKRVANVVHTPLKLSANAEKRERVNLEAHEERRKREAAPYRGRFRGQTQSQYLNVGNEGQREGKAEAEATQQSSRAVVSGSSGMGQAQSMSSGADGCEGCPGYDKIGTVPAAILGSQQQQGLPTGVKGNSLV